MRNQRTSFDFRTETWRQSSKALRLLSKEVLHDLPPGGAPDAGVRANVFERRVQHTDPLRLAGDEGARIERHNPKFNSFIA